MALIKNIPKFQRYLFLVLILSSTFNVLIAMYIVGTPFVHKFGYGIFRNLALAWLPYLFSLLLYFNAGKSYYKYYGIIITFFWFIFLPNAPYLITNINRFDSFNQKDVWIKIIFLFTVAWNGVILAIASLFVVQQFLILSFGKVFTWVFIPICLILCSFGVYLGRDLRPHSVHIFTDPLRVIHDIGLGIKNIFSNSDIAFRTFSYAIFMMIAYVTIQLLISSFKQQQEPK